MRIKDGFVLREIVGSWIVVPIGKRILELNGLINLSESGAKLWNLLAKGSDEQKLLEEIMSEYTVDENTARLDIKEYIAALQQNDLLEQAT